ncbi:MAG TPA: hypothetical protein VD865_16485 [Stenotrophomonas sp.]|nr:hypothetical protein [Stenotrophomonas sp.]
MDQAPWNSMHALDNDTAPPPSPKAAGSSHHRCYVYFSSPDEWRTWTSSAADAPRIYGSRLEQANKPTAAGIDNNKQGNRVNGENLDKTRRCFGQRVRDICERTNQSSRWQRRGQGEGLNRQVIEKSQSAGHSASLMPTSFKQPLSVSTPKFRLQ